MTNDRLGRGLGALLGDYAEAPIPAGAERNAMAVPVRRIVPNPHQPRVDFKPEELAELAASIRANGLIQPIVVRPSAGGSTFELVAGERRFRAVQKLGWSEVPALVREVDDRTLLVLALVENIQREQLGPLEEAQGYAVLRDEYGLTQGEIAEAVGKSRSTVANVLRLLGLPPSVRRLVEDRSLSAGHARALLALNDPVRAADLAKEAVSKAWSVREVEKAVQSSLGAGKARAPARRESRDPAVLALEQALQAATGTRATIRWRGKGDGSIRIPFSGPRDLERLFQAITGREAADILG